MLFKSIYSLFNKKYQCLGIDIGTDSIKVIAVSKFNDEVRLDALALVDLPQGTLVNKEVHKIDLFEHALKLIRKAIPRTIKNVAIAITGSQVITKLIQVDKTLTDTEIEHHLYNNLKLVTAKMVGEVNIDYVELGNNEVDGNLKDVFVVVAKQSLINTRISALKKSGFHCAIVDLESHALTRSFQFQFELSQQNNVKGVFANVHIGEMTSLFIVIADGELVFSRELNIGVSQLRTKTNKPLNCDWAQKLVTQLSHCQQNYLSICNGKEIDYWLSSGGGAHFSELIEFIANTLNIDIHLCQPLNLLTSLDQKVVQSKHQFMPTQGSFQVALGLAVRGLT